MSRSILTRCCAGALALVLVAGACGDDDDAEAADVGADEVTSTESGDADGSEDSGSDDGGATVDESTDTDGTDADADGAGSAGADADEPEPGVELDGTCTTPEVEEGADATDLSVKPPVTVPTSAPDELTITDIVDGGGAEAATDDFVIMEYVGVSCSTGEQFDASWDRDSPFPFLLGAGSVIDGWDQGIAGMKVGGRRTLVIPPELGYGEAGSGSGSILPGETLIFVVDLVGLFPADASLPDPNVPAEPATELVITDLVEGDGDVATAGSQVLVHYVGVGQASGERFDASLDRGVDQPYAPVLGSGDAIAGLDEGIVGMAVGGVRELVVPAELAFGESGAGEGVIAPGETLVFTVELFAVL